MAAGFATAFAVFTSEMLFRFINGRQDPNNKWAYGVGRTPNGRFSFDPSRWLRNSAKQLLDSANGKRNVSTPPVNTTTPPPPYQSIFNGGYGNSLAKNPVNKWKRPPLHMANNGGVLLGVNGFQGIPSRETNIGGRRLGNSREYGNYRNNAGAQFVSMGGPASNIYQYQYTE